MDKKTSYTSTKISSYIGYFVQAIVNNFLPILFIALQDVYGIGYEKLGRLVMFNFVTQMITDILSPKIIAKTGYRKAAIMCQFTAAAGLAAAAFLPKIMWDPYWGIVIAIIIYAFASESKQDYGSGQEVAEEEEKGGRGMEAEPNGRERGLRCLFDGI